MAPFVLKFKGNKSFSPLSQISDAETLTRTWKVCTKVASHLEQGQRLENLSWRLWFLQIALVQADNAKQKREFKKFSKGMSDKLDKDKGRSIHELQAPNFKRTDSTDKVRLRVEEMAHQRDSGPGGVGCGNGVGGRFANDPDAAAAHYMKNMQYTFAVDPRVKPLATTAMPPGEEANMSAAGNKGRAGGAMMGKMRVRPMHPPPVPIRAQQQQGSAKDASGDTTMNISSGSSSSSTMNGNNVKNDHAMDVSDDHGHAHHRMDEDYRDQRPLERVQEGVEYEQQVQQHHQDDDFQFDTDHDAQIDINDGTRHDNELDVDGDPDGVGHHTPTPQHLLLPSHHPSALPYPPPPPTLANAHALSNALSGSSGLFIPSSSDGSNSSSTTPRGASYTNSSMNMNQGNANLNSHYTGSNMNMNGYRASQNHQTQIQQLQPNIIRFPTIFSSDFGPTSLLCALPTNSNSNSSGPSFSFESTASPGPGANVGGGYQSFSALSGGANGHGQTSSSVTTQGIYGPHSGMSLGMTMSRGGGLSGIGVGMQNAETSFDFGVPRPTFEFPIEEILKGEGMGGDSSGGATNGNGSAGMTAWDANNLNATMNLLGDSVFGMGAMNTSTGQWSVQPQEIHSPTEPTSPTKGMGMFQANIPSRQNSLSATVAYGNVTTGVVSDAMNQQQQARNSLSPSSAHSSSSNPHVSNGGGNSNAANVKSEGMYEGGAQSSGPATVSQQMSGGATASGSILGGSGGVGSVVPGNVGNTAPGGVKSECANCGATHTPLWRRGLNDELNCNACGLYCKLHKRARPKNLRTSHGDRAGNAWGAKAGDAELAGEPVQCHNCATMATPLWRKDDEGNTLCNACGLYLKLHGNRRPLSMKSDVIRKRSRHETEKRTSVSSIITVMTPTSNLQNSRRNSPTPPPSAGSSSSGPEPFIEQATANNNDPMAFPFSHDLAFGGDSDYMSGFGMGMGADLSYASFGSYVYSDANSSASSMGNGNGLASPTSPTELQHIVETTVMAGVENGGGHAAPSAKRRRMTLESAFSGSSLAHTSGGTNSAHSSPTGLGQKPNGNSPPYFSLDATLSIANNGMNNANTGNTDQSGHMSPTRSTFGNNSPPQPAQSMSGITYDFYGYPIHPPMAPLHPPSLIHPHSMMWGEPPIQHTPKQSSMSHARSNSQSLTRSPSHSRRPSHSHSRSNSHNITMPLYLYDGGASSRAYEGANAPTPTGTGNLSNNPTDEELFSSGFDMFTDHSGSMDENRVHYGPTGGI